MRSSSRAIPAVRLALLLAATASTVKARAGAVEEAAPLAETSPTGFAAVNALGRNGTTGGAGGATVNIGKIGT